MSDIFEPLRAPQKRSWIPALDRKFVGILVIVAIISTAIGVIIFSRSAETI